MNYSQFTLDRLLKHVEVINSMKPELSQLGLDRANAELSAIEAELTERQPEFAILIGYGEEDMTGILPYPLTVPLFVNRGGFVTLLGDDGQPVGFEPKIGD